MGHPFPPRSEQFNTATVTQENPLSSFDSPFQNYTSGHEDDALFGDLFSEACRQVVISDGHEQPCSANDSVSD